jgi:phosphoglycerate dehydrogenase-like enzyme
MPVRNYAAAIRERLPEYNVTVAESRYEERKHISDAWIATDRAIDPELIDRAENLRLFAGLSAGYDHIPLDKLREADIAFTNASGVHGPNMAEQAIGWILTFTRGLHEGWRRQQRREWRHFHVGELQGSTVTIVGLGAIGKAVVDRLGGFGVETVGVRYSPKKGGPTDKVIGFDYPEFEPALARTDYLVLTCPLTETTQGLIGDPELTSMQPDSVLINMARGGVVDTDALVKALRSGGGIRGAALDVTEPEPLPENHPLWNLENALITPHMAGYTPRYYERRADILARNVRNIEDTEKYDNLTNQIISHK